MRKNLTKTAAILVMSAMVAASALTACGSKAEETTAAAEDAETTAAADGEAVKEAVEGKDPAEVKVGISIYQFADNFMTLYRNELQNYLVNELGLKAENISIMDGKNDQSEQMNQIRNFVTQGFDVMIVNLVQASSEPDVTNICNEAGIPVVYINREPDAEREEAWVTDGIKATYVGADARQSGTYQGEEIAELENKGDADGDGVVRYIMVQGDPENVDAQYRTEFSVKALEDAGLEVNCLTDQVGNWQQDQAQQNDQNDPSRTTLAVVAAVSLCRWHPSHLPFKLYGHFTSMEKENQQKFVNSC